MAETTWSTLSDLVSATEYRPGWRVGLRQHDDDLTLEIFAKGYDSYHPDRGENYRVIHSFLVPPATYNRESWTRWLLDRFIDVETHEACEFFVLKEDAREGSPEYDPHNHRPFAPNHGPGWNPYGVRELNAVAAAETTSSGAHRSGTQGARA